MQVLDVAVCVCVCQCVDDKEDPHVSSPGAKNCVGRGGLFVWMTRSIHMSVDQRQKFGVIPLPQEDSNQDRAGVSERV